MIGYFDYKDKFFITLRTVSISILVILIVNVICINSLYADKRSTDKNSGLAIVIGNNLNNDIEAVPMGMDGLIMTAFGNYSYHYLQKNKVNFKIFITDDINNTDSLISSLYHQNFTKIIFIKIYDLYFTTSQIVTDKHGRKYFKQIEKNLDLGIIAQAYNYNDGDWSEGLNKRFQEQGNSEWYKSEIKYTRGNESIVGRPEPYEFIIQRAVISLFDDFNNFEKEIFPSNKKIPLKVYLGDDLRSSLQIDDGNLYRQIINHTSDKFYNQFGLGFNLTQIEAVDSIVDEEYYYNNQLNSEHLFFSDTVKIFIFKQFSFWEYFNTNNILEIGYSRLGNKAVRIKLFPERKQTGFDWNVYYNSLALLHEIGHSFGAIHASDINSIMNYSYSWVGPKAFDPVNEKIIKASLQGKIHPLDVARYLTFISMTLQNTDYGLIDFPSFFYEFLELEGNKKYSAKLRGAIGHRPFLLAIDGYAMLKKGENEKAANLFRSAIRYAPEQASLHYYLSLVTKGRESFQEKRRAIEMGYIGAADIN